MPARFLTVVALLQANNELTMLPGFLTEDPSGSDPDPASGVTVEFFDDDGALLLRHRVAAARIWTDGPAVAARLIEGKVPFPPASRRLVIREGDAALHESTVPEHGPTVRIDWEPPELAEGRHIVRWAAEHPDGLALTYVTCYSGDDGRTWRPVSLASPEPEIEVDFDRLPGSRRARIGIFATDGVNTALETSRRFAVTRKKCQPMIIAPRDGLAVTSGESVTFVGQGYLLEEDQPELENLTWRSSIDGALGRGPAVQARPSDGHHEIILAAGRGARRAEARIEIDVTPLDAV